MMNFLLVGNTADSLKQLETGLQKHADCQTTRAASGEDALSKVADKSTTFDLVIVDGSVDQAAGKTWVEKIIAANAMVNTALVSDMSDEDFHEETEGLGILMRIPPDQDESYASKVVERLSKVLSLYQSLGS